MGYENQEEARIEGTELTTDQIAEEVAHDDSLLRTHGWTFVSSRNQWIHRDIKWKHFDRKDALEIITYAEKWHQYKSLEEKAFKAAGINTETTETDDAKTVVSTMDTFNMRFRAACEAITKTWQGRANTEPSGPTRTAEDSAYEFVDHPEHYGSQADPYEVVKVARAWNLGLPLGSVLKYIRRHGRKPGTDAIEDLQKAIKYLEIERDFLLLEAKTQSQ